MRQFYDCKHIDNGQWAVYSTQIADHDDEESDTKIILPLVSFSLAHKIVAQLRKAYKTGEKNARNNLGRKLIR